MTTGEDSVVLCSPPDAVEAQTVLSLLSRRGIACRLEPRGIAGYPTALGNADVIRVRRGDLSRAQELLDRWHEAAASDGEGDARQLAELAIDAGREAGAPRDTTNLEVQRDLFRRHGPVTWEHGLPWVLVAIGLFGALEELWSGSASERPTGLLLWIGCGVVGAVLALPSTGLRDAPLRRSLSLLWELDGAGRAGHCERVLELSRRLLETLPEGACPYLFVNVVVNQLITCGRYGEALALPERWSAEARERGAELDPEQAQMTEVNQIEVLYNLGRLAEARARLDGVPSETGLAVVAAGLALQRGWLAALEGDADAALAALDGVTDQQVPYDYRAELWFARASALSGAGRHTEAREAVQAGLAAAVRAPSERNALFMLADVTRAEGALQDAAELYARGAEHAYRGQGGDALLAWGDVEQALGRPERAQAAWALATERDPESAAAARAQNRLQG